MDKIIVDVMIKGDIKDIWSKWTQDKHIKNWYFASDDWHVPNVEQNFEVGKTFTYRMEAKDGSMGFDFSGTFTDIKVHKSITYVLEDNRKVVTNFEEYGNQIHLIQEFEPENDFSLEMQKQGWQAILNNYKKYVEK